MVSERKLTIGAGLKMYLGNRETIEWLRGVAEIAKNHPAVVEGVVDLFVLPGFTALFPAVQMMAGTGVKVGAQDLFWEDRGAFTGEVSGTQLAELGCSLVEVGHAERRRLFGETDNIVAAKMLAAFRNGLTPVLCVGEIEQQDPELAANECVRQLESALASSREADLVGHIVVAYEPQWAIGAAQPADIDYIRLVVDRLLNTVAADRWLASSFVIYGGSVGPGLLTRLDGVVDGLFIGRFSHDPEALRSVLDEAWAMRKFLPTQ